MRRFHLPALVGVATLLVGGPAAAATPGDQGWESVRVSGTGEVSARPDTLAAAFGVQNTAPTVGAALKTADAAATRMRDALVRAGVARADLQTSDAGIAPEQNDDNDITGYTVTEGLTAKIRDLPKGGAVISAAIAAGGDAARLNGVSFSIEDDTPLLMQARKKAFADARAKAELYAEQARRPLGRVLTISEEAPGYVNPFHQNTMAMSDAAALPIEPGQQQLSVTVTVEWALTPGSAGPPAPRL
jgi:uncharacterized protein YggE